MDNLFWFIHIAGITLWFGVVTAGVMVWPRKSSRPKRNPAISRNQLIQALVLIINRTTHPGAGLTALGGAGLSLLVQPKSELGDFWVTTMQGLGVVAFILSVVVLTRIGKRIKREMDHDGAAEAWPASARTYHTWLVIVFLLLLISLLMAAFKPMLS